MAKETWTKGHFHKTILNNVLADQYLTAMCVEDYISSMSEKDLDKWVQTFIKTGAVPNAN
tara:strand:+ start:1745 stop:1924 length:180 start_codon:yes stop_codon:yes gene_type:complete